MSAVETLRLDFGHWIEETSGQIAAVLNAMNDADALKVLIVNEHGQYLAGTASHWEFTEDRIRARVFDFQKDKVRDQLELVRKIYGLIWIAVKLDVSETHEFCDRCGARMTALEAVFDGAQFLCPACQIKANPTQAAENGRRSTSDEGAGSSMPLRCVESVN